MQNRWAYFFLFLHCVMIVLFGWTTYYVGAPIGDYSMWMDIHVMISLGFGFLMAFMSRCSFVSTGHSYIATAFVFFWAILNFGFWHRVINPSPHAKWDRIHIGLDSLVNADFCSGSVLISFGAIIGKVSLSQLLLMCFIEVIFYSINEAIVYTRFNVADMGGSMVIHLFGATFGLACSLFLERDARRQKKLKESCAPAVTHNSDTLAMIGTIFLWSFWPSFNGYLGGHVNMGNLSQRAAVNTCLAITASTVVTAFVSSIIGNGKISMVDLQNATLAGGVACGAISNMYIQPYGALIVGSFAGLVSTLGFNYLSPFLDRTIGLKDTCGILNLHCMPGFIGAIVSVIVTGSADEATLIESGYPAKTIWTSYGSLTFRQLAGNQLAGIGTSVGLALLSGSVTGVLLRYVDPLEEYFDDATEYIVHDDDKTFAATKVICHHANPISHEAHQVVENHVPEEMRQA
jgi:ammonium transporter Rh